MNAEEDSEFEKKYGCDPNTLYRSIGHFVFNFSRFEDVVRGRFAAHLELNDRQRQFIMRALDFAFLCESCKSLFADKYCDEPDKLREVTDILNEGLKINTTARVPLAHGSWYLNLPAGLAVHTPRNNPKEREFFEKPGELDALAERLFVLRHRLWALAQLGD